MDTVLEISNANAMLFRRMVADVAPEQMCLQPNGMVNHAAWQIGHVSFVRASMVQLLGGDAGLPPGWAGLFAPGTTPTAEAGTYPSKQELLAGFEQAHRRVLEAARGATAETLGQPTPIPQIRSMFPKLQHLVAGMLTTHDGMHLGQLSVWRRVQGLPRVI